MFKNKRIGVVVPAYNEEDFIGGVIKSLPDFVDHIIVVDDCSYDNTISIASNSNDSRIIVLKTAKNEGVGGATITGYEKALELGSDIVVKMDGDGQMLPEYMTRLLEVIVENDYDYAKGNRFLKSESLSVMPKHRLFGNIILTFMNKLASGQWHIFDPQNGYTAIRAEALRALNLNNIHKGYFFENDMLIQINLHGFRVKDVSIPAVYGEEKSDIRILKIIKMFPVLFIKRFFYRIYHKYVLTDFSPIALFLISGLILFSWGMVFGSYLWIKAIITGVDTPLGTVMLVVVPLIVGFQLLLQAIVLDIHETKK
ncbi:glycosyltransferase family 2 protein [candidate division WS5 bacterium]|uniref:Glycosyltransferase family 2 protein n=1 Tax=candidate division WS5 bacterium TaxID=2093353 RepID=A0A419D9T8_9BACT|nr:MAG: glycosyltransferase family 2 protein [candidate division WS5 bacterium]